MIDPLQLRRVSGHFVTGVAVITAAYRGRPCGLTVNAFGSLSLDPPQVLVCVNRRSRSYPCLEAATGFAVNVLATEQEELARRFASLDEDKFRGVGYRPGAASGAPLLAGAHAFIECRTAERYAPAGTHAIFIGEVLALGTTEAEPLVFYRGSYTRLAPER